jgi:hypothetical protein
MPYFNGSAPTLSPRGEGDDLVDRWICRAGSPASLHNFVKRAWTFALFALFKSAAFASFLVGQNGAYGLTF